MSDAYTTPHENVIAQVKTLTQKLSDGPLDLLVLLARADAYTLAGYPDLAAADAYVGLTLIEAVEEEDEIDEDALLPQCQDEQGNVVIWPNLLDDADSRAKALLETKVRSLKMLVETLVAVGCLRDAWMYYQTLTWRGHEKNSCDCQRLYRMISDRYRQLQPELRNWDGDLDRIAARLPSVGLARRDIYPWNEHKPDLATKDHLKYLNDKLKEVAPDLEVRVATLPDLSSERNDLTNGNIDAASDPSTRRQKSDRKKTQLGLFATKDLKPGTVILREKSLLTATRDGEASLCDACAESLPELGDANPPVACEECRSAVFCSPECYELGMHGYHGDPARYSKNNNNDTESVAAVAKDNGPWPFCSSAPEDLANIGRDPTSTTPAEDLYFLLFTRAVAMAEHQRSHPLDLDEVRWLWGDFSSLPLLPWTLKHNVIQPLSYFSTLMQLSSSPQTPHDSKYKPYSAHWLAHYDFWIVNTLFAKFRGVASARQSIWDGRPEVAGVHWRWSLANHSCAPGVRWVWGGSKSTTSHKSDRTEEESRDSAQKGEIVFVVRDDPVWVPPAPAPGQEEGEEQGESRSSSPSLKIQKEKSEWMGIKADQEILSHYCDVDLDVRQRREWARGALGGICGCQRCVIEAAEEDDSLR